MQMETPGLVKTDTSDPGTAITLQVQLDAGKHFIFQTALPRDADLKTYHQMIDKLNSLIERLEWKRAVIGLNTELVALEIEQANFKADYERVSQAAVAAWVKRGKQGDPQLTKSEQSARSNSLISAKARETAIESKKALIVKLEARIAESEKDV